MANVATGGRAAVLAIVVSVSAWAGTSAVAGKVMTQIGLPPIVDKDGTKDDVHLAFDVESLVNAVLAPAGGAGKSTVMQAIIAIFGLLFLAAIIYFVFGLIQGLRGARGGVETAFSVVAALVIAIVGFQILA